MKSKLEHHIQTVSLRDKCAVAHSVDNFNTGDPRLLLYPDLHTSEIHPLASRVWSDFECVLPFYNTAPQSRESQQQNMSKVQKSSPSPPSSKLTFGQVNQTKMWMNRS